MKKKILIFIAIFFYLCTSVLALENIDVFSRKDLNIDESLVNQENAKFALPQKILVTQIKPNNTSFANDTESWIRLLHYYSITRLGFSDIPFNYIVDRSGNVYEGLEGAEGRFPEIDSEEGTVLIAYFSDTADLTLAAEKAFKDLIESYSYKYGIPREAVQPTEIYFTPPNEGDPSLLSYRHSETLFAGKFFDIVDGLTYSDKSNIKFYGIVENLEYPKSIEIGEEFKVEFKLKNSDSFPWYIDNAFVFLSTADGEDSEFAINQVWESFSKPLSLKSQVVLPGQSVAIDFALETSTILPGVYKEDFAFILLSGEIVEGSAFSLEFEVIRGNTKIAQIRPTGTGALTVYSCPEYTCEMVAAAISGERYIVLDERDRWYEISVDGVRGWVTIHYADLVD